MQIATTGRNKKNIINLSAELAQSVVKVEVLSKFIEDNILKWIIFQGK